jgi:tight adherence protein C
MSLQFALFLSGVFASVLAAVGGILWMTLHHLAPQRRRLREITGQRNLPGPAVVSSLTSSPHVLLTRIAAIMPRTATRTVQVRERLAAAGYRSGTAPSIFTAAQLVLPAVSVGVVIASGLSAGVACFVAAVGYALPDIALRYLVRERQQIIANALPDLLDLLVLCLESGCSLDQAMLKTSEELKLSYPPLAEELTLVGHEIRAGRPRADAFRQLGERTGVEDVRTLVSLLSQADRYGTSVIQALQVNAELLRTGRRQNAEERAARASVKLVFPLVFCLFPAFYIVALGPAILQFMRVFVEVVASVE